MPIITIPLVKAESKLVNSLLHSIQKQDNRITIYSDGRIDFDSNTYLRLKDDRGGAVGMYCLVSTKRRQGYGSLLLKYLTKAADKHRITLRLYASANSLLPGALDQDQLEKFYERFGFEESFNYDISIGFPMIRKPKRYTFKL